MVTIKKGTAKDFESFLNLFTKTLRDESFLYSKQDADAILSEDVGDFDRFKDSVTKGNRYLFLAFNENKIVGYFLTTKTYAGVAFGWWLGVEKEYRNQGIGSRLVKIWEEDALQEGAHSINLWTTENDLEFYRKLGFNLGGKFPKAWFGLDHYLFFKNLK